MSPGRPSKFRYAIYFYLLILRRSQYLGCSALRGVDWKGFGWKRSRLNRGTIPELFCRELTPSFPSEAASRLATEEFPNILAHSPQFGYLRKMILDMKFFIRNLYKIFISCVFGPPLWFSGQSSWLQIQGYGFDSWHYQTFGEVVGLERGPLSFMSTIEELLGRKSSGSGLESRECARMDPLGLPRDTLYLQKLALTSPPSGGRSVGIVRSRTKATELLLVIHMFLTL
jgi:hypothetical protein